MSTKSLVHNIGHIYKITEVSVCLSVCLSVWLSKVTIVHDHDRSFCPIFLEFGTEVSHLTTKTKFYDH